MAFLVSAWSGPQPGGGTRQRRVRESIQRSVHTAIVTGPPAWPGPSQLQGGGPGPMAGAREDLGAIVR